MSARPFGVLRWIGAAWLTFWVPAYGWHYGLWNFVNLCDVAVVLACAGFWWRSSLLLSTQALSSLVIDSLWCLDVVSRVLSGQHWIGGTEYMWTDALPLWLRLLSLFHVALPPLLLYGLQKVGYERRALALQSAIALLAITLGRLAGSAANLNFAYRDPFLHQSVGPPALHVMLTWAALVAAVYVPMHLLLMWLFPRGGRTHGSRCGRGAQNEARRMTERGSARMTAMISRQMGGA